MILQKNGAWGQGGRGGPGEALQRRGLKPGVLSPSFVDRQLLPIDSDCGLPVHGAKVQKQLGPSPLSGKCECASVPHVGRAVTCQEDACTHIETDGGPQANAGRNILYCTIMVRGERRGVNALSVTVQAAKMLRVR